ncbi:MAG: protein kinase domain-containing protein [Myxococcota bacterium]
MLSLAAESIVATSGVAATVVDVVHGRALDHYGRGLKEYLAVQLGSVERAGAAFGELRAAVVALGPHELTQPPGVRARLYGQARRIARRRMAESGRPAAEALPWRTPRVASEEELHRLRGELPAGDAELLELRHARELLPEEAAAVVELPPGEVTGRLAAAEARARSLLGDPPGTDRLSAVLLEAFALEPFAAPGAEEPSGEHAALPEGTIVGGRYAIERRVGSGAFGDVYRANDTEVPGHEVALKLLHQPSMDETARAQALRELHLIASVFHPSVVQFKDHGWHENRLWFVMPWYEGETLEDRIERAPLSRREARSIFEPLARALATMHAAGIRHQDVKPENIFLARIRGFGRDDGEADVLPVLIDLGVAAKEAEMVIAGTPDYFAPEVAAQFASVQSMHPVGYAADVFSLALSLRNALEPETREDVPAGAVEAFIERRARNAPPPPRRRDLKFLEPFFRQCLSLDPDERPSADELADRLSVLTQPEERRRRIAALLRWLVPLLVAVGAVFGAVVYGLNARAEREALEAERAKTMAFGLKQDLELSLEQQRALEADVSRIRDRYARGQMSRRQLAEQLGNAEGRLGLLRSRLAGSEQERRELEEQLGDTRTELEEARAILGQTQEELQAARADLESIRSLLEERESELVASEERVAALQAELADARSALDQARTDVERARAQAEAREKERVAARAELTTERARARRLEREVRQAEAARRRAEARVARLERRLAGRRGNAAGGNETGSPEPDPPEEGEGGDGPEG